MRSPRSLTYLLICAAASAAADPPIMGGHAVFTSNDGKYGVIWRSTEKIILVRCSDGHPIKALSNQIGSPGKTLFSGIAFSGDGTKFACAATDRVLIWSSETGKLLRTATKPNTQFYDVALSQDGSSIATTTDKGVLLFTKAQAPITLNPGRANPICAHGDTFYFTIGGETPTSYLITATGKPVKTIAKALGERFSPSGRYIASANFGRARLGDLDHDLELKALTRQNAACFWDGETLVVPSDNGVEQIDPVTNNVSRYRGNFTDGMYLYYGKKKRTAFFDFYSRRLLGFWPHFDFVDTTLPVPARDTALLNNARATPN